jgi:hypothetical protein
MNGSALVTTRFLGARAIQVELRHQLWRRGSRNKDALGVHASRTLHIILLEQLVSLVLEVMAQLNHFNAALKPRRRLVVRPSLAVADPIGVSAKGVNKHASEVCVDLHVLAIGH